MSILPCALPWRRWGRQVGARDQSVLYNLPTALWTDRQTSHWNGKESLITTDVNKHLKNDLHSHGGPWQNTCSCHLFRKKIKKITDNFNSICTVLLSLGFMFNLSAIINGTFRTEIVDDKITVGLLHHKRTLCKIYGFKSLIWSISTSSSSYQSSYSQSKIQIFQSVSYNIFTEFAWRMTVSEMGLS